jgi:hypothetical protein
MFDLVSRIRQGEEPIHREARIANRPLKGSMKAFSTGFLRRIE